MNLVLQTLSAALVALLLPLAAYGQSAEDLKKGSNDTGNVLNYGMDYGQKRYSPLDQINKDTVKYLVPVWNYSLADDRSQESQAFVHNGVLFISTHNATIALDAKTGKQKWKTKVEYPPETPRIVCCGIINRGVALYDGKVFRTTLDAHIVALDAKTGKELWKSKVIDWKNGYSQTLAPLIADGVIITGTSGAEYGIRGFIDGWDPNTGKQLWRTYTIPGPGEPGNDTWPGDTWKRGGGSTWITGSYDPDLRLVYWGVGNAAPWNAMMRSPGDNLYTASVLALDPKTGTIKWHFQFSPNDPYDYDAVADLILVDRQIEGKERKLLFSANRNGFFYVLDRTNGEFIAANQFVKKQNWADGIDKKGRPIESQVTKKLRATETKAEIWPSVWGGKAWSPSAYNPKTGLVYANTMNLGMTYTPTRPQYRAGTTYWGADLTWVFPEDGNVGQLAAIEPMTGKWKWSVPSGPARWSGVLATGGGLVFSGQATGEFDAFDADTGKRLWQFQTGSGIEGQPVTWKQDGIQYVAVAVGHGGAYAIYAGDERLQNVPAGGSLWVFALHPEFSKK